MNCQLIIIHKLNSVKKKWKLIITIKELEEDLQEEKNNVNEEIKRIQWKSTKIQMNQSNQMFKYQKNKSNNNNYLNNRLKEWRIQSYNNNNNVNSSNKDH